MNKISINLFSILFLKIILYSFFRNTYFNGATPPYREKGNNYLIYSSMKFTLRGNCPIPMYVHSSLIIGI